MQARYASFFGCCFALLLSSLAANAQYAYTIIPLDNATTDFHPQGINNLGQISGYAYTSAATPTGYNHAFYYTDGQLHDVSPGYQANDSGGAINDQGQMLITGPSAVGVYNINTHNGANLPGVSLSATLSGINQNGDIVGTVPINGNDKAFIYHSGTGQMQYLPNPSGTTDFTANAINNNSQVTGNSSYTYTNNATLYTNGVSQDLGNPPGTVDANPTGINDAGDITGYAQASLNGNLVEQSFLYHNGQYINIGRLGNEPNIFAVAISNDGDVIGGTYLHPFIYHNGQLSNLFSLIDPSLGWTTGQATAINDQGWIVGYGNEGGFLMKPNAAATPAPGSLLTFGAGIGAALLAARRKRRVPA